MTDETIPDDSWARLIAVYTACNGRAQYNGALQWQVPGYVLAAQGALLAGVVVVNGWTAFLLSVVSAVFGVVGMALMQRIELTAWFDRERLDQFEALLLPEGSSYGHLRLWHDMNLPKRLTRSESTSHKQRLLRPVRRVEWAIARRAHPSLMIFILMVTLAASTMAIGCYDLT